jgi:hypothetical protein
MLGFALLTPTYELRRKVKDAGGRWLKDRKLRQLPYTKAIALGLRDRIRER